MAWKKPNRKFDAGGDLYRLVELKKASGWRFSGFQGL